MQEYNINMRNISSNNINLSFRFIHTIGVETLNPINLMDMKNALITIKVSRLEVIFVNVHGVRIRIIQ